MTKQIRLIALCSAFILCAIATNAQTTAFTYQGKLSDGTAAANGTYDLGCALFDAATNGAQIGAAQTRAAVAVTNGVFTVQLDFGAAAFPGANRFLQIAVKKVSEANFTTLASRQPVTAMPYAIRTLSATAADALSANCVGCVTNARINSVDGSKVSGTVARATNAATADSAATAATAENVRGVVAIANGGTGSTTKNFVDTTTAQTVAGVKTFADNLRTSGLTRAGSETGTSETPSLGTLIGGTYDGLVTRRLNSFQIAAGQVAARTNALRLERDGSFGGWRIAYDALPLTESRQSIHCLGINNAGAVVPARLQLNISAAGATQLYTHAQNVEYLQCSFGNAYFTGHQTQVVLQRMSSDGIWIGTVTSTFNQ